MAGDEGHAASTTLGVLMAASSWVLLHAVNCQLCTPRCSLAEPWLPLMSHTEA